MAADESAGDGVEQEGAGEAPEAPAGETRGVPVDPSELTGEEEETTVLRRGLERLRPLDALRRDLPGRREGGRAAASSVAYYIIEPGKHTGLHSDNAEEIVFVAEGEGEAFVIGGVAAARGRQVRRLPGRRRPRHLRAGRGCAAAALVLPDHRDREHLPAGDLPDRRRRSQLEAARAPARGHRARSRTTCRRTSRSRSPSSEWPRESEAAAGADRRPSACSG